MFSHNGKRIVLSEIVEVEETGRAGCRAMPTAILWM